MGNFYKYSLLFFIGGFVYYLIEIIYRGYSHWTMAVLGGFLFVLIGLINEFLSWDTSLLLQGLIGCISITVFEFITGCIVNLWLGWHVWDYSDEICNVFGQISLPFIVLWYPISIIAIIFDDYIRYWIFGEEKPRYKLL